MKAKCTCQGFYKDPRCRVNHANPRPVTFADLSRAMDAYTEAWEHVYSLRTTGQPTDDARAAVTAAGQVLRETIKRLKVVLP
jgi:hypothetical protein